MREDMSTKANLTADELRWERLLAVCMTISKEKNLRFPPDPEGFVKQCLCCYGGTKIDALIDFLYNLA